jgi:hypothetical protein
MTSMRRRGLGSITLACALAFTVSVRAHHSHGNYVDTFTDIEGVVKEVHLMNPHSWIYLEVNGPNGQPQNGHSKRRVSSSWNALV